MEKTYPVQKERAVDVVKILDLDRHILDTELFHVFMREAAWEEAKIDPGVINDYKIQKEQAGQTLHTDELIYQLLTERDEIERGAGNVPDKTPDQQLQAVFAWMLELCEDPAVRDALFMPGAKDFVGELEMDGAFDRGEAFFLTWGTEPLQMLKLRCLNMTKHGYLITQERAKGRYIANTRTENDTYEFVTMNGWKITANEVELYDDKASSFTGLPSENQGARGYWKLPSHQETLPSQMGSVPENVRTVNEFPVLSRLGGVALHQNSL